MGKPCCETDEERTMLGKLIMITVSVGSRWAFVLISLERDWNAQ